jgi:hypothetical protein
MPFTDKDTVYVPPINDKAFKANCPVREEEVLVNVRLDGLASTSVELIRGITCRLLDGAEDNIYVNTYVDRADEEVYFVASPKTKAGIFSKVRLLQQAVVTVCLVATT